MQFFYVETAVAHLITSDHHAMGFAGYTVTPLSPVDL